MNRENAYTLFEEMIDIAVRELIRFTKAQPLSVEQKADKSVVTACDKHIGKMLYLIAEQYGLPVVSEEGEQALSSVKGGTYLTIDEIDGTVWYIDHVNFALEHGGVETFLAHDIGRRKDFCLLLGIVEDGMPRFGACYVHTTGEKILVDAESPEHLVRGNIAERHEEQCAIYLDSYRDVSGKIVIPSDVTKIYPGSFGIMALHALINPHQESAVVHRAAAGGLWDVLPAAVAARAFGGEIYDDLGRPIVYTEYVMNPGNGLTVVRGKRFLNFVGGWKE